MDVRVPAHTLARSCLTYCVCSEPVFAARRKVAKVHAGFGVIVYCNGVMLIGQQRLNESEGNYRYQRNYQYACSPIAPKFLNVLAQYE